MGLLWQLPLAFAAVILFSYHVLDVFAFAEAGVRFFMYCVLLLLPAAGYYLHVFRQLRKVDKADQPKHRRRLRTNLVMFVLAVTVGFLCIVFEIFWIGVEANAFSAHTGP
jgi:cytochrome c biogenesis protein CcdA